MTAASSKRRGFDLEEWLAYDPDPMGRAEREWKRRLFSAEYLVPMWRYRDPLTGLCEVTDDPDDAALAAGGDPETVLVHRTDGLVDRVVAVDLTSPCEGLENEEWPLDGLGHAYRYMESRGGWEWTSERVVAEMYDECYETFWVVYEAGVMERPATREEWRIELEVRIGRRLRERVPERVFRKLDAIGDDDLYREWLDEHVPDWRTIVMDVREEMDEAAILEEEYPV